MRQWLRILLAAGERPERRFNVSPALQRDDCCGGRKKEKEKPELRRKKNEGKNQRRRKRPESKRMAIERLQIKPNIYSGYLIRQFQRPRRRSAASAAEWRFSVLSVCCSGGRFFAARIGKLCQERLVVLEAGRRKRELFRRAAWLFENRAFKSSVQKGARSSSWLNGQAAGSQRPVVFP